MRTTVDPDTGATVQWLVTAEETLGRLARGVFTLPAGGAPAAQHAHPRSEERVEVLAGTAELTLDGARFVLTPGEKAVIPAGARHGWRAIGDRPLRLVVETEPAHHHHRSGADPMTTALGLEIVDLGAADRPEMAGVLARGMRDNPLHVAAYGTDPDRRERVHGRLMAALFAHSPHQQPIGLRQDGVLVAVAGCTPPGTCRPTPRQQLALLPAVLGTGPRTAGRVGRWLRAWQEQDPAEPHAHLGPVAVDRHLQGYGLGTQLLAEHARRLDAAGHAGYLETDKPENVAFYRRCGYEVIGTADVIGVPNWFMWRAGPA